MVWIQDPDPKTTKMSDLDPQQRTWFRIPKLFLTWGKGTSSTWICTQTPITWGAMSLGCQSPLLSLLQESTTWPAAWKPPQRPSCASGSAWSGTCCSWPGTLPSYASCHCHATSSSLAAMTRATWSTGRRLTSTRSCWAAAPHALGCWRQRGRSMASPLQPSTRSAASATLMTSPMWRVAQGCQFGEKTTPCTWWRPPTTTLQRSCRARPKTTANSQQWANWEGGWLVSYRHLPRLPWLWESQSGSTVSSGLPEEAPAAASVGDSKEVSGVEGGGAHGGALATTPILAEKWKINLSRILETLS